MMCECEMAKLLQRLRRRAVIVLAALSVLFGSANAVGTTPEAAHSRASLTKAAENPVSKPKSQTIGLASGEDDYVGGGAGCSHKQK